jgi:acetylornithine deacetylase/succinyl-diaminopimelate desuccinylase-like protein
VKIPRFYDDVEPLTPEEKADFARSGFSLEEHQRSAGLRLMRTQQPLEAMERLWALPTFEVHGVVGGYSGPGSKSIVPGRAEVKASFRLVPRQQPERVAALVERFITDINPDVEVRFDRGSPAYRTDVTGPYAGALKRALAAAFGAEPVFVRDGGSIGALGAMERLLRCPVLFLDLSLPDHGYHAPNEHFEWGQAEKGMVAFARLLAEVAALGRMAKHPEEPARSAQR